MSHICSDCTFVNSANDIFIDKKTRDKISRKAIYVGNFTLPEYRGHVKFYLFRCRCGAENIDYPHGYLVNGYLFFNCNECASSIIIYDKNIYKDNNTEKPSIARNMVRMLQRLIKSKFSRKLKI